MIVTNLKTNDLSYTFNYSDDPLLTMDRAGLSERHKSVVCMRFGLLDGVPKTYEEIRRVHGVSVERIKTVLKQGIDMLRYYEEHERVMPSVEEIKALRPKVRDPKWQNSVYLKIRLFDDESTEAIKKKIESLLDLPEVMQLSWKDRGDGQKWQHLHIKEK
jgi:Sigma-70, region 4